MNGHTNGRRMNGEPGSKTLERAGNPFLQEEAVLRSLDNDAIVAVHEIVFERGNSPS
jgi:hypothetical protein